MFRKVLVPLDGSRNAEHALPWIKHYAAAQKAMIILVRVLRTIYPLRDQPFYEGAEEAKNYLQSIERELHYAGIPSKIVIDPEPVSRSIVETARSERCDLIVMTSRGASRVVRWLVGGVTEQVMRLSPVPVLIVRSQIGYQRQARVKRILVPLDGSELSSSALPWAERLAKFHRARLVMLNVRPPSRTRSKEVPRLSPPMKHLLRSAAALRKRGIRTAFRLNEGDAAEEILRECRSADLLVMTTHGYGGFKHWIFGSVAEKVIREAPVPVFIYKGLGR